MNKLFVKLKSAKSRPLYVDNDSSSGNAKDKYDFSDCHISFCTYNSFIELTFCSNKDLDSIEKIFLLHYRYLFYLIGHYLKIESVAYYESDNKIDRDFHKDRLYKYYCDDTRVHHTDQFTLINPKDFPSKLLIFDEIIKKDIRGVLQSFEYLLCDAYSKILTDHRFTLATHIIEGFASVFLDCRKTAKILVCSKCKDEKTIHTENYRDKVTIFFSHLFIAIQNSEIDDLFSLLNTTPEKFISSIVETRHVYSHMISGDNKENKLESGSEFLEYFYLFYIALRLNILLKLEVEVNSNLIKETLLCYRDWLAEKRGVSDPKSKTYQIHQSFERLIEYMKDRNG